MYSVLSVGVLMLPEPFELSEEGELEISDVVGSMLTIELLLF